MGKIQKLGVAATHLTAVRCTLGGLLGWLFLLQLPGRVPSQRNVMGAGGSIPQDSSGVFQTRKKNQNTDSASVEKDDDDNASSAMKDGLFVIPDGWSCVNAELIFPDRDTSIWVNLASRLFQVALPTSPVCQPGQLIRICFQLPPPTAKERMVPVQKGKKQIAIPIPKDATRCSTDQRDERSSLAPKLVVYLYDHRGCYFGLRITANMEG